MNTPFDMKSGREDRIVYVRPVDAAELPEKLRADIDQIKNLYAVHAPDGERLALVEGRSLAFALARQNDFAPVTVH
ncbi:DUF1150 family protein [Litoreibacter roseus]|uniref:DUF1150 family protein n=1 Tax=Litoreibacter roseus TaxID=2601869 RepID=A0A6N6JAT2_9RHOB|nr:DUF1150 family protein [Litoreibacter roseus]GFE63353.1 hypothetical protein KIN_04270 [Litoreibacter roseus]